MQTHLIDQDVYAVAVLQLPEHLQDLGIYGHSRIASYGRYLKLKKTGTKHKISKHTILLNTHRFQNFGHTVFISCSA